MRSDPIEKEDTGEKPVPSLLVCIHVAAGAAIPPLSNSLSCAGPDMYSFLTFSLSLDESLSDVLIASSVALNSVRYIFCSLPYLSFHTASAVGAQNLAGAAPDGSGLLRPRPAGSVPAETNKKRCRI